MPQYVPNSQTDIANLALMEIGQQPIADIEQSNGTAASACRRAFWPAFGELAEEFPWTCLKKRLNLTALSFPQSSSVATAFGWPGCRPSTPPPYWEANTLYAGGTLVTWGEAIYYALYTHTSGTNFVNDMTNGLWAQIYSRFISFPGGGGADGGLYEWAFGYALPSDYILAQELNGTMCWRNVGSLFELFVNQVKNDDNTVTTTRALFTDAPYADLKYTARIEDTTIWDPLFVAALAVLIASKIATPILADQGAMALQMRARYDKEMLPRAKMKDYGAQKLMRYDPTQESQFIRSRWISTVG